MASSAPGTVVATGNPYVDAVMGENKWNQSITNIGYAFTITAGATNAWVPAEMAAVDAALAAYGKVANLEFEMVNTEEAANLEFYLRDTLAQPGSLGQANGPEGKVTDGLVFFSQPAHENWLDHIDKGGFSYYTIIHEIGHALGLEHPHDKRNGSGLFPGVGDQFDKGEFGLNVSLNTMMSYNNRGVAGWSPVQQQDFGFIGGPMAFDIAALQYMYGKNMDTGKGSETYVLPGANETGTYYSCIWDSGGIDSIVSTGDIACSIDLRAAPLTGKNAGGYLSRVDGIFGGFTIANGVMIENASGGGAADTIAGNGGANVLNGLGGNDILEGMGGKDILDGGFGFDVINGGSGVDEVSYAFYVASTGMTVDLDRGKSTFAGDPRFDTLIAIENVLGGGGADRIVGNAANNVLDGSLGDDRIEGGEGRDTLIGNLGEDTLTGGAHGDKFRYTELSHSSGGFVDTISDFVAGVDDFDVGSANIAAGLGTRTFSSTFFEEIFTDIGMASPNGMLLLTVTGNQAGTYLFINDENSAANWTKDALIDISGMKGTLSINDFV